LVRYLGTVYAKKIGPYKTFFWSQLAGCFLILVLISLFSVDLEIPILVLFLLPIASFLYSAGYLFFMKGFEIGNISIIAAVMNLWAVFTMLFAFIFMGQRLSTFQFTGVLMIICGSIIASLNWSDIKNKSFQLSVGVKETVIGAFFFGTFWNVSEFISEKIGWLQATLFIKFGIIFLLLLFSLIVKREISLTNTTTKTKLMIALMGIIEAGAIAIVNFGLTIGDAILITPIASALSVVTIFMAIIFLKEKILKLQIFGVMTTVSGLILTAF
jgi:transporter family protein